MTPVLARHMREWRARNHVTLDEHAAMIGIPVAALERIDLGKRPRPRTLARVVRWLALWEHR